MGVNSSQAGDVLSASATRPPLDAASASPLSLLLYRRRIRAGPAAAAASDSSVDERTMRTIEAAALNADIFARGESDHARPTFDRVALLWTPHDEMFAAHAEAQEATLPQHLVATPRQCAHHAAAASSIVRSSARDISLGIATDVQRYLPPASTLPRVTLDKDDDTLALADASQNSRLPIDPARCMVFEAVVNHGVTKSSAFSVRCVTLDEILSSDCVCAAVRPLALDGYSLIKQNRFDARKPAPEFVSPTGLLQWSDRGLCVYREWERVLDAFKASVLPRLLPSDRDASQLIQSILASLAARVSAAPPEPRHLVATSRIFSASVAVHGVDGKIPHDTLVSTLSLLPHLLGGQQSTVQILEQLEPLKDASGAISEDDFVRVGCAVCGRADILARISDEAVSAAFVAHILHSVGLLAAPLHAASVADFYLARRGANFASTVAFAESSDGAPIDMDASPPASSSAHGAAVSRLKFAPHVAVGDERSVRRPKRVLECLDHHNIELE